MGAGLIFGSVLGYGAYQTSQDPTNIGLSIAATSVLGGLMGYRYYNSGKLMPAGLIAIFRYYFIFIIIFYIYILYVI